MSLDGYSFIADWDHIDKSTFSGIVGRGGQFHILRQALAPRTPRIMAEVVNFYEAYIYPLLDSGYSTIAEVWGRSLIQLKVIPEL